MSSALNTAILQRLNGTETFSAPYGSAAAAQATLASVLGRIPGTGTPGLLAIVNGNRATFPKVNPIVTFRQGGGVPDAVGTDILIGGPEYDIEVWDSATTAVNISQIADAIEGLLEARRTDGFKSIAPPLPLAAGHCYWGEEVLEPQIHFDAKILEWYALMRFRFVEARY